MCSNMQTSLSVIHINKQFHQFVSFSFVIMVTIKLGYNELLLVLVKHL